MERRQQKPRALARRVGWLLQLSKELDRRRARATGLLQAMVEFVGEAHNGDTNSSAELPAGTLGTGASRGSAVGSGARAAAQGLGANRGGSVGVP